MEHKRCETCAKKTPVVPDLNVDAELENLQPSKRLLEYYRSKVSRFDGIEENLLEKLDSIKQAINCSVLEGKIAKQRKELIELRGALSDVNVFIHAERQQVAKLYAENERLKIDVLESEKKVSLLLSLSGLSEAELRVFLRDPKRTTIIKQRLPPKLKALDNKLREKTKDPEITDAELSLFSKLESLETQLNAEKAAWIEEKNTFLQDRTLCRKENEAQQAKDEAHIKLLVSQLEDAQVSLMKTTREIITCQSDHMNEEKKWLAERDHLFSTISTLKEQMTTQPEVQVVVHQSGSHPDLTKTKSTCELKDLRRENEALKRELSEAEDLRNLYENQSIKLEQEACMLKEKREAASNLYKKRVAKLNTQLELMKKQYRKLDQRRHNESKGFCADIRRLKDDIRVIVKLLYKITVSLSSDTPNVNFESLNDLQALATLTRTVQRVITDTKRNIMSLENQVYGGEAQDP